MTTLVASALLKPLIADRLPAGVTPLWFETKEEALALAPQADIGWFDMHDKPAMAATIMQAEKMVWLNTIYAGLDELPFDTMQTRGVRVTNGAGLSAITISEYVLMGMLSIAKGYREIVHAQGRHEWLVVPPGRVELAGTKALLIGYGEIGKLIHAKLSAFDIETAIVRRTAGPDTLAPDQWRARLGEFDWIILAMPATPETAGMMGAAEFAAMKPGATLVNIARGSVVDQDALVAALQSGPLGHAFLDVTTPEPLPADHVLWTLPNAHITMHLSGQSYTQMFPRAAARFLGNLERFLKGDPLTHTVNLALGY